MGVPSKIKAVKVFDDTGVELTDVVVTNSDEPPEVSKKQKTEMQMQIQIPTKTVPQRWARNRKQKFNPQKCPSFRASSQELGKKRQIWKHLLSCMEPRKTQQICSSTTFSGAKTTMLTWFPVEGVNKNLSHKKEEPTDYLYRIVWFSQKFNKSWQSTTFSGAKTTISTWFLAGLKSVWW